MIQDHHADPDVAAAADVRRDLLEAFMELADLSPSWRMGQLMCNVADFVADGAAPPAVWDATDEQLLAAARELIRHRHAKT